MGELVDPAYSKFAALIARAGSTPAIPTKPRLGGEIGKRSRLFQVS